MQNYIAAAKACPNIYLEITFSSVPHGIIPYLCRMAGSDRVLFGSDMLWRGPESQLGWVAYSELSDEEKRLVLRENMLGILRRAGVI
ncbi:MAG TPA: amidohydrolase family protein [Firmicutes bacterium]|nr:amidohydrolase family protein [Bacillota bacterium]